MERKRLSSTSKKPVERKRRKIDMSVVVGEIVFVFTKTGYRSMKVSQVRESQDGDMLVGNLLDTMTGGYHGREELVHRGGWDHMICGVVINDKIIKFRRACSILEETRV